MFGNCLDLKEIKFNNNTTTKNLVNMSHMFRDCVSLEYIDTTIFKENQVTDLSSAFENCYSLKEIDLSYFSGGILKNLKKLLKNVKAYLKLI